MASINVNVSRLHAQGTEPKDLVAHLQTWEKAGYKVYFQVQNRTDLTLFQKMVAPQTPKAQSSAYQLASFFLFGMVVSLISVGGFVLLR
jgi:hypothetical protein